MTRGCRVHVAGTFDTRGHIRRCQGPVLIAGRAVFQRRGGIIRGVRAVSVSCFHVCILLSVLAWTCVLFRLIYVSPIVMGLKKKIYTRGVYDASSWFTDRFMDRSGCPCEMCTAVCTILSRLMRAPTQHCPVCLLYLLFLFRQDCADGLQEWVAEDANASEVASPARCKHIFVRLRCCFEGMQKESHLKGL